MPINMFKRSKKKSPSAKDIAALSAQKKDDVPPSYSSLPKNLYSPGLAKSGSAAPARTQMSTSLTLSKDRLWSPNSPDSQEMRANSPLDLPMETLQSISAAYNIGPQGFMVDNLSPTASSPLSSKPSSRSPFQSPVHNSRSMTNSKASTRHRSLEKGEFSGLFPAGDQSLDRQLERLQMMMPTESDGSSNTMPASSRRTASSAYNNSRDRSLEREQYPHMGARSLEREHFFHSTGRSRSNDRQEYIPQHSQSQEFRNLSRDSLILELQSQITDLNKDCAKLQQDLDSTKDKLSSTMNSIKTFWSPELKKERSLRKEESAKYSLLNEQLKVAQAEVKKLNAFVRELESQIKQSHDAKPSSPIAKELHDSLKRDHDHQTKEVKILRKTVEEMDLRLETQRQTLQARDESIKKLLEMLQSKGVDIQRIEESEKELERLQVRKVEDQNRIEKLGFDLERRDRDINVLKEEVSALKDQLNHAQVQLKQQPASTHTMQAIMEAKDSRIAALEKELQNLEDKLHRFGQDGTPDKDRKDTGGKDTLPSREKALRAELDSLRAELANKDTQITSLKMKTETSQNQKTEQQHYINVLKEQISAKEQNCAMFQAEIEDLRERIKEKDDAIEKKSRHAQVFQMDKRRQEAEVAELKDHIDIKERKINVLMRKIENLEDLVREKDDQLQQSRKVNSSSNSIDSADSAMSSMEESLYEKDRQIERLKELRDRHDKEHQEECEQYIRTSQELKSKNDNLQMELTDKQTELCELREEVAELKTDKYKADTKVKHLEQTVIDRTAEVERLNQQIQELQTVKTDSKPDAHTEEQLAELSKQVEACQSEMQKAQAEVDRLLEILKETENEKNEKDNQIKELQDTVKEYKQKFGTLKRMSQTEKKKNAQLLEEARRREEDICGDTMQLKSEVQIKAERIEELEEALRESVKITAEREMVMANQQELLNDAESKITELTKELETVKNSGQDHNSKLSSYIKQLEEKDHKLRRLQSERHKHLEEVYEMKQEAIQAAISEKDANIALLEMTSTKKQKNTEEIDKLNAEKEKLHTQLKELTQNRMRLLHKEERGKNKKSHGHKSRSPAPPDPEQVEPSVKTAPESTDS